MTNFHPSDNDLIEYSSGNMDWALGICVSAHLHYCPKCRLKLAELNALGGMCLTEETKPLALSSSCFTATMAKIKSKQSAPAKHCEPDTSLVNAEVQASPLNRLPKVLQKIIVEPDRLKWSFLSPSLKAARLTTQQEKFEVCLHKIKKGGKAAAHDHLGLEVTLVLEGSFSDEKGTYVPGDYIVKRPGDIHRPTAAMNKDCLCLSVVEAPVKLTGFVGGLINPFLKVHPQ